MAVGSPLTSRQKCRQLWPELKVNCGAAGIGVSCVVITGNAPSGVLVLLAHGV